MIYRQGDIFIQKIDGVDEGQLGKPLPHGILARGEATGHSHRLETPSAAQIFPYGADLLLRVNEPTTRIIHDEHGPIALDQGSYRVWRQREYSPEAIRRVLD